MDFMCLEHLTEMSVVTPHYPCFMTDISVLQFKSFAPCYRASSENWGVSYRHHKDLQHLLVLQKAYMTTDKGLVSLLCHQNLLCQWNLLHPLDKHTIVHLQERIQQSWMWGKSTHLLMLLILRSLFSGAHLQDSGEDHTDSVCVCMSGLNYV